MDKQQAKLLGYAQQNYYLKKDYYGLPAADKIDRVWDAITVNADENDSTDNLLPVDFSNIIIDTMSTFAEQDIMPWDKQKIVHSTPSLLGKVEFVVEDSNYSGFLRNGTYNGIMRIGLSSTTTSNSTGMGLKLFRDNLHSANIVFLNDLLVKTPCEVIFNKTNLFDTKYGIEYSNHTRCDTTILAKTFICPFSDLFAQYTDDPFRTGLSDFTKYTIGEDGCVLCTDSEHKFPFEIMIKPVEDIIGISQQKVMDASKTGLVMFNLYTKDKVDSEFIRIGHIKLSTKLIESRFGDTKLFFQHQRVEEDELIRGNTST